MSHHEVNSTTAIETRTPFDTKTLVLANDRLSIFDHNRMIVKAAIGNATPDECFAVARYTFTALRSYDALVSALRACEGLLANSRMGGQNRPEQVAYDKVMAALALVEGGQ